MPLAPVSARICDSSVLFWKHGCSRTSKGDEAMNNEVIFRLGLAVLILVLAAVRVRFIGSAIFGLPQTDGKPSLEHVDRVWYRLLWLFGWLWVIAPVAYVLAPRWLDWARLGMPILLRWIGVGVGALSIVFLAWVHRTLGKNWNVPGVVQERQALVTNGPYKWIRHPMYTAFVFIALAYWLISTNWFIALIGLGYCIIVVTKVSVEEDALIEKFGEAYRNYTKRTRRFLPRFRDGGT